MSPLLEKILTEKTARRRRLMELSYPEKVRIVEQMRSASIEMKSVMNADRGLREPPDKYEILKTL